ncbi:MAG: S8 family serine peptidase [Nocardioides sp.]|nr:S8 family serine peptidase [Nocardioides sp.]
MLTDRQARAGVAATAVACALVMTPAHAVAARSNVASRPYVADHVLVGFTKGTTPTQRRAIERRVGAHEIGSFGRGGRLLRVRAGTVQSVIAALEPAPGVRYAEPDFVMEASALPNDRWFRRQWSLRNHGQTVNGIKGKAGADVRATAAWKVTKGSRKFVIAEVDSGIAYKHPDLAADIWTNPGGVGGCPAGTHGYNAVSANCDPMDDFGHGTHVAGIMGAVGNNRRGITGVERRASLMPVKFINAKGYGTDFRLLKALGWVIVAKKSGVNVRVVNDSGTWVNTGYSQAVRDKLKGLAAHNILFVTAAGNSHSNNDKTPRYPCSYGAPNEICVAATNQRDRLARFSNYGVKTVDLAAPGNNIYSTLPGGTYGYMKGTSMASPMVAATAALVLARKNMSTRALKSRLLHAVDPLKTLAGKVATGGRLDACKAVPGCAG